MIKYNKDNKACHVLNTFHMGGRLMARVRELYTDKVTVVSYDKWQSGDFSFDNELGNMVAKVVEPIIDNTPNPVQDQLDLVVVTEPVEQSPVTITPSKKVRVRAITPKGKEIFFNLEDIEEFCGRNKLDVEAVQSVLAKTQKTHRKWGFVEVE